MEDESDVIFISIGAVAMTFIAIGIIAFVLYYANRIRMKKIADALQAKQMQKEMYNVFVQTQENEKLRLARNLHDEMKPLLATIKNKLQMYQMKYKQNDDFVKTTALVSQAYEIIQNTTYDLVPSFLVDDGVFRSLQFQLTQANNALLHIDYYDFLPNESENYFSQNRQLHIYRVVLEVFNNIIKHDNPKKVTVSVERENDTIIFLFTHNGKGIDEETIHELKKSSRGLGLTSINARMGLLNGEMRYFKAPDFSGVKLFIPIKP